MVSRGADEQRIRISDSEMREARWASTYLAGRGTLPTDSSGASTSIGSGHRGIDGRIPITVPPPIYVMSFAGARLRKITSLEALDWIDGLMRLLPWS